MGGNIRKLRWVFIIGSAIPLIAYIFWQLATLGSISSDTFVGILAQQAGLNGLLQAVRDAVASPHVELAVHLFADLALATSFLGVALGLFDFLADLFKRQDNVRGRLQTGAITFLPPLAFALFYPRGFVLALGFAAIALSVLALLLPSLLVWKNAPKTSGAVSRLGRYAGAGVGVCLRGDGHRDSTGHRQRHAAGGGVTHSGAVWAPESVQAGGLRIASICAAVSDRPKKSR